MSQWLDSAQYVEPQDALVFFQYRCSHFTLCCTSICIQPALQSNETTLMSNITSLALIEESTATPFPLLCHHGSSLSEDTPHTDLHRVVKVTIWVTAQADAERASLYSHQEKKQYQTPSRLHTVKTPTLKLHTRLYTHRVTSTQNKQSFKKLWLRKWPKTLQRNRTNFFNLSRADCSFASHSLATLWDAKTNSRDLHQHWLSAKIQ